MTAIELNKIANRNKKNLEEIKREMIIMAEAGLFYYCVQNSKILEPELYGEILRQDGFTVNITTDYFKITW